MLPSGRPYEQRLAFDEDLFASADGDVERLALVQDVVLTVVCELDTELAGTEAQPAPRDDGADPLRIRPREEREKAAKFAL